MLSPIILMSSCFLDAMLMLSFVQISLEVSSTSTSTFPRVLIVPPLLSLQVVTLMRYTIIKTAATLVLLKQCGEFSNSLYTAALQLSTGFSCYTQFPQVWARPIRAGRHQVSHWAASSATGSTRSPTRNMGVV